MSKAAADKATLIRFGTGPNLEEANIGGSGRFSPEMSDLSIMTDTIGNCLAATSLVNYLRHRIYAVSLSENRVGVESLVSVIKWPSSVTKLW